MGGWKQFDIFDFLGALAPEVRSSVHAEDPGEGLRFVGEFEVRIQRRKGMKRMRMRVVPPDGHVEVHVPWNVSYVQAEAFVLDKADWIRGQQEKARSSVAAKAELATDEEKKLWREAVSFAVPYLVARYEPLMGVKVGSLAYRNMKSRWGSCQPSTGRICINTRLALYPPECLEYVVVHEMCHLLEGGHGPRFKALLDRFYPGWRHAKALLDD